MENNSFQTSFIPKKPINTTSGGSRVGSDRKHSNPFATLSIFILIITILSSGGLFFYKNYLNKKESDLSTNLNQIKNTFDLAKINDLELFDKRISASRKAMEKHIVLSPMFSLLGEITIPAIQYTAFNHKSNIEGFLVSMSGVSPDYRSIAQQADLFNTTNGRYFKNVIFSNLSKDIYGNITFDVQFSVDPSLLSYENNFLTESQ